MSVPCVRCGASAYVACKHREATLQAPPVLRPKVDKSAVQQFSHRTGRASGNRKVAERWQRMQEARARAGEALSEYDAAAYIGLAYPTLQNYRSRGLAPIFEKQDGAITYRRADLDAWLAERSAA